MSKRNNQQELNFEKIFKRPTPKLNKIEADFYKVLSAIAAKFIPDACNALREDWIPTMDDKTIGLEVNTALRDEMRETVLDRFSKDRGKPTHWNDETISHFFPPWLLNPRRTEAGSRNLQKARSALLYQKSISQQSHKIDNLVKALPEPYQQRKLETDSAVEIDEPLLRPLGTDGTIPLLSMEELNSAQYRLWKVLTGKENWAHVHDDLENDHIKPTREYRKSLLTELGAHEQGGIARRSKFLIAVLEDTIQIIERLQSEK